MKGIKKILPRHGELRALVFLAALVLPGCKNPAMEWALGPAVKNVSISPGALNMIRGETRQLTAVVHGEGGPPQSVAWSLEGNATASSISADGRLSVGLGEPTGTVFTVKAVSTFDAAKSAQARVTITLAYSVSFNTYGGSTPAPQVVLPGNTAARPDKPLKSGSLFIDWYADSGFSTLYDFSAPINTDTTVYAKWYDHLNEDFNGESIDGFITVSDSLGWADALSAISGGGANKNYIIELGGTASVPPGATFGTAAGIKVSLWGDGTLALSSDGTLISVNNEQTLTIRGPTLQGKTDNTSSLVSNGGTLFLKDGKITGNKVTSGAVNGGGVYNAGTFTMTGGEISGNKPNYGQVEGGAYLGGRGGGVYVANNAQFTLSGGTIFGNDASYGGGVAVVDNGSFFMNGGTIAGNTAEQGAGVHAYNSPTFKKTDGTIYGQDVGAPNWNRASSSPYYGHVARCSPGTKTRNATADSEVDLDISKDENWGI